MQVDLRTNAITGSGEAIGEALKTSMSIKTLLLASCDLSPEDGKGLADGIAANAFLTELDLYANRLGDAGVADVCNGVKENKEGKLKKLTIGNNSVGPAGVESVAALLEATLWSAPILADEEYTPKKGEIQAFHDNLRTLADGSDIFTRFYGQYENKTVVNHCPGALIARQLLISGWECCTKTPAPTVE